MQLAMVYPRVCGGTNSTLASPTWANGLSPRVRGNLTHTALAVGLARSIPACAGEPSSTAMRDSISTVYPRVCGGTAPACTGDCAGEGLSPRVRGNLTPQSAQVLAPRSIPACAGEPLYPAYDSRQCQVYPRVCGGTQGVPLGSHFRNGLSPRVRGNPRAPTGSSRPAGSIPACAGEPRGPV